MAIPTLLSNGFSNVHLLGVGSYGQVFCCTTSAGKQLAVKISFDESSRTAAAREAELMGAIPEHKNILPLVSFTSTSEASLLALPLAEGGDTLKLMQERNCTPLTEIEAHGLFTQLLSAVEHMHNNGFVHRDIKCENILLSGRRRRDVQLADFGFATRYIKGQKALSEAYGSLHYSSPEIVSTASYEGPEVDIWSTGVVLYAWCTGRLPFGGETEDEIKARILTGSYPLGRHFTAELSSLISGMLEVDPSKRLTMTAIWQHPWVTSFASTALPRRTPSVVHCAPLRDIERRRNSETNIKGPNRIALVLKRIFHA